MTSDNDDKKLADFLKINRPFAPRPRFDESDLIWEKYLEAKGFWSWREISVFAVLVLCICSSFFFYKRASEDMSAVVALEESLNLEFEDEELLEVRELIALTEKGQE